MNEPNLRTESIRVERARESCWHRAFPALTTASTAQLILLEMSDNLKGRMPLQTHARIHTLSLSLRGGGFDSISCRSAAIKNNLITP